MLASMVPVDNIKDYDGDSVTATTPMTTMTTKTTLATREMGKNGQSKH